MLGSEFGRSLRLDSTFPLNPWMQPHKAASCIHTHDGQVANEEDISRSKQAFTALMAAVARVAVYCDDTHTSVLSAFNSLLAKGWAAYPHCSPAATEEECDCPDSKWLGLSAGAQALLHSWLWCVACWMGASLDDLQLAEFAVDGYWGDYPGPHCSVLNGMSSFVNSLAEKVPHIAMRRSVVGVDYSGVCPIPRQA